MKKSTLITSLALAGAFIVGCSKSYSYKPDYEQIFLPTPKQTQAQEVKQVFADDVRFVLNEKVDILDKSSNKKIGTIFEGSMVKIIEDKGEYVLVSISGEVSKDKKSLAFKVTDDNLLTYLTLDSANATPTMEFLVKKSNLTNNIQTAWEEIELTYYDTCTSCHSAHNPKEHPMDEWDAYISAMQINAKITDKQKDRMLRFMQAHASDGAVK